MHNATMIPEISNDYFIHSVEIKCQLIATEVFIADLIACSTCFGHHYAHHQELKSIIQWLLPVVFRAVGILFPHINDDARSKSHQICNVKFKILRWYNYNYDNSNVPL